MSNLFEKLNIVKIKFFLMYYFYQFFYALNDYLTYFNIHVSVTLSSCKTSYEESKAKVSRKGGENSLILLINDATERNTRCHGCFSVARCMSLGVDFAEDDIASTNNHFSEVFSG